MFIINISEITTLLLVLAFTVLMIYLGKETKKSFVPGIALAIYLILLIVYVAQFLIMREANQEMVSILARCMAIDFLLILATYLGYLWIDSLEIKSGKKKSFTNEDLDWLWKRV